MRESMPRRWYCARKFTFDLYLTNVHIDLLLSDWWESQEGRCWTEAGYSCLERSQVPGWVVSSHNRWGYASLLWVSIRIVVWWFMCATVVLSLPFLFRMCTVAVSNKELSSPSFLALYESSIDFKSDLALLRVACSFLATLFKKYELRYDMNIQHGFNPLQASSALVPVRSSNSLTAFQWIHRGPGLRWCFSLEF